MGFIAAKSRDVKIIPIAIYRHQHQWFKPHYIIVGDPIHVTNADGYRSLAQYVMETIYDLKNGCQTESTIPRGIIPQ